MRLSVTISRIVFHQRAGPARVVSPANKDSLCYIQAVMSAFGTGIQCSSGCIHDFEGEVGKGFQIIQRD